MLTILVFTDSIADAALAAGLGSSVIIVFVHPTSKTAQVRHIVGGHILALVIGAAFASLFFVPALGEHPPAWTLGHIVLHDIGPALSLGVLILAMALTDTEHPPAAGTVLGMAFRPWDLEAVLVIIAAVAILGIFRGTLGNRLKDLV